MIFGNIKHLQNACFSFLSPAKSLFTTFYVLDEPARAMA